ncbi:MAG: PAS domain S-box protein [Balneola sp.]|nr:MAG: PAS domain S-box protein [Balneola sp.]
MSLEKSFWSWNIQTGEIHASDSLKALFGITTKKTVHFDFAKSLFNEERLNSFQYALQAHVESKGEIPFRYETIYQDEGGIDQIIEWVGEVVYWGEDGSPILMSGHIKSKKKGSTKKQLMPQDALFFYRLMDNLNESIFFKDKESRFIRINNTCARKFGLDHPREAIGKTDFDFFEKEHAQKAYDDEQEILRTKEPIYHQIEREVFLGSKEVRWTSTSKQLLYDNKGRVIGTFGITRDVTNSRLLEAELEEQNKRFSKLSELAPGFLYLHRVDKDGKVSFPFVSSGIRDMFDMGPEMLINSFKPLMRKVHRDDIVRVLQSITKSVKEVSKWDCEYRIHHPEKGERWVKGRATPELQEDGSILSPGFITDITDIKRVAEINERLRKQFQSVLNQIPNLIFVKNRQGRYIMVNDSACDFFEIPREEFLGKTDLELGVDEERARLFLEEDLKVIETQEIRFIPEFETKKRSGEKFWHQTIKLPFKQIDSREEAVLTIVTDITGRKRKEEELDTTLDIITQQNQRLRNFAHIVSHNLRNHAGNISMLLSLYDPEESESEKEEILGYLETASERLNESISDLNEIVDQQQKTVDLRDDVNLKEFVEKTKEILITDILTNNVKFEEQIPNDLIFEYNPAYLESIILNLFTNAIKYRKPELPPLISTKAWEEEGSFYLEVSDNGLGIDLNRHGEKLFGMYKTFHGNENAKGIGLFITKNQVESMGGSIEVQSEAGLGTTFKIRLK